MKVKELLNYLGIESDDDRNITSIVTSHRDVIEGCVFICVKGDNVDPSLLINKEILKKCHLILTDSKNNKGIYIEELQEKVFDILYEFYFPKKHHFKIIAITGTEGKSSLANFIFQSLRLYNKKALLISNNSYNKDIFLSSLTTPCSKEIIDAMIKCQYEKYDYLIMELSSIGILKKRINEKYFDYMFLTNLNSDHLDYHNNLYNYHYSKIHAMQNNKKAIKFVLTDTYNKYPNLFNKCTNLKIIDNEYKIKNYSLYYQTFIYKNVQYYTKILFKQNIINLIFVINFLNEIKCHNIFQIIKKIKRIKGRCDLINSRPYVIIDNAHSKESVKNILVEANKFKQGRIILVIGAGGERDKTKRSFYGNYALKYSDVVIVTNDNPRNENPMLIIDDITKNNKDKFTIILSRKEAINEAIKMSNVDDLILILGRGNEDYQIINDKKIYLNDYVEVRKCLHR